MNEHKTQDSSLSMQIGAGGIAFAVKKDDKLIYASKIVGYDVEAIVGNADRYDDIYVGWSDDSVVLIPKSIFDKRAILSYVKAANYYAPGMSILYNDTMSEQVVAVWCVEHDLLSAVEEQTGEPYHYHNLLIDIAETAPESIRIGITENRANVVVRGQYTLYTAETISFESIEDLLYFVLRANSVDKFARNSLNLIAENVEDYAVKFEGHFPYAQYWEANNYYHTRVLQCV